MKTFNERCYEILKTVPKGKVTTYKEIANALGTKAYRAVGNAMKSNPRSFVVDAKNQKSDFSAKNPYAPQIPCHRVVNSNGTLGGFASGSDIKIAILKSEGIEIKDNKIVDFNKKLFKFDN